MVLGPGLDEPVLRTRLAFGLPSESLRTSCPSLGMIGEPEDLGELAPCWGTLLLMPPRVPKVARIMPTSSVVPALGASWKGKISPPVRVRTPAGRD